jgi:adenine phosphoribosyltransferase
MTDYSSIKIDQLSVLGKEKAEFVVQQLRTIQDFPKPGILFWDIMGVLKNAKSFQYLIDAFYELAPKDAEVVVGTDSRGFLLGTALAYKMGLGFVPIRKAGKLPPPVLIESYNYEYATGAVEIAENSIKPNQKILVIDDLIATGGTIGASKELIEKLGGNILEFLFFIELEGLDGAKLIEGYTYKSLIKLPA